MQMTRETVSPKKAMEWLKRNVNNRPLSDRGVELLADAMSRGEWKLNGDCIRFNNREDLIDGQHRLHACVRSGKTFETYVVRGLDADAFDTIDQGRKRTISDVFARHGHKNYTVLASAVRWLWRYQGNMIPRRMRSDEANELLEKNPGLHRAVSISRKLCHEQKLMNCGLLAFLIYECGRTDSEASVEFWTSVIAGERLSKGTPAYRLNHLLISNLTSVAKVPLDMFCALGIKAWNLHRTGKTRACLKFSAKEEEFPRIIY